MAERPLIDRIFEQLRDVGEFTVYDLAEMFSVEVSVIEAEIAELEKQGRIKMRVLTENNVYGASERYKQT